jgi:hypothetical protein
MRKTIGVQHRGTFIPSTVIDAMPMPVRAEGDNVVALR